MKLHDLRPAAGSRKPRTRVGRGIAPVRARPPAAARRARRPAPAARSRPGSRAARRPSTSACPSCAASRTPSRSNTGGQRRPHLGVCGGRSLRRRSRGPASAKAEKGARHRSRQSCRARLGRPDRHRRKPVKILGQGDVSRALRRGRRLHRQRPHKIEAAGGFVQLLAADGAPAPEAKRKPPTTEAESPQGAMPRPRQGGAARLQAEPKAPRPRPEARAADSEVPEAKAESAKRRTKGDSRARRRGRQPTPPPTARPSRRRIEPRDRRGRRSATTGQASLSPPQGERGVVRACSRPLINAFRAPDIRRRILFVLGMLVVYRALAVVPVPAVDHAARRRPRRQQPSCSCSTCSRAVACARSRSWRWASTRTSTPRSSCS